MHTVPNGNTTGGILVFWDPFEVSEDGFTDFGKVNWKYVCFQKHEWISNTEILLIFMWYEYLPPHVLSIQPILTLNTTGFASQKSWW